MYLQHINLDDYDAVAFDVEGTLANTVPVHYSALQEAVTQHGYGHITEEQHDLGQTYGSSVPDITGGILHAAGVIGKTGPFRDHPTVQEVVATKKKIFEGHAAVGFEQMPGAVEFMQLIAGRFPDKIALVTSSPERFVIPFLEKYQLHTYFSPATIIGEESLLTEGLEGKPAPDPYKLAMRRLGAKKLLVFEDVVSGVTAAKKAGATVIALGFSVPNAQLFQSGKLAYPPDAYIPSYTEARQLLGL